MTDPVDPDEPARADDDLQAEIDSSMVLNAKKRHGALGGALAAGMLGLDQAINGRKVRQEAPVVVDANSDPVDVDADGIVIDVADDTSVVSPPLPRTAPITSPKRRRR